jgi:hypothetical protein
MSLGLVSNFLLLQPFMSMSAIHLNPDSMQLLSSTIEEESLCTPIIFEVRSSAKLVELQDHVCKGLQAEAFFGENFRSAFDKYFPTAGNTDSG